MWLTPVLQLAMILPLSCSLGSLDEGATTGGRTGLESDIDMSQAWYAVAAGVRGGVNGTADSRRHSSADDSALLTPVGLANPYMLEEY